MHKYRDYHQAIIIRRQMRQSHHLKVLCLRHCSVICSAALVQVETCFFHPQPWGQRSFRGFPQFCRDISPSRIFLPPLLRGLLCFVRSCAVTVYFFLVQAVPLAKFFFFFKSPICFHTSCVPCHHKKKPQLKVNVKPSNKNFEKVAVIWARVA